MTSCAISNKPAIFVDRDGVLTLERGYLHSPDELVIYDYSRESVDRLHAAGYLVIVITNQSAIARGYISEVDLKVMNERLIKEAGVDDVFYCPHHPEGTVDCYNVSCNCRKPAIGLLQRAYEDYHIDLVGSYFIGDRECDIKTGQNAGVKTILVRTGYGKEEEKKDLRPDYVVDDLRAAVDTILLLGE